MNIAPNPASQGHPVDDDCPNYDCPPASHDESEIVRDEVGKNIKKLSTTPVKSELVYSVFASVTDINRVESVHATWDKLVVLIKSPKNYANKSAQPLLKLAEFGNKPNERGALRHDGNVDVLHGIEGDYDAELVTPDQGAELLRAAGIRGLIYTSGSHGVVSPPKSNGGPRWRVLVPFASPARPSERAAYVSLLNGALGGILATESWTLSQTYYYGRVHGVQYEAIAVDGECLDIIATCPDFDPIGPPVATKAAVTLEKGRRREDVSDPAVEFLETNGWVKQYAKDGKVHVRCPWEGDHTTPDQGPSTTTYFPRGLGGRGDPGFECMHGHCKGHNGTEFLEKVGFDRVVDDFSVVILTQEQEDANAVIQARNRARSADIAATAAANAAATSAKEIVDKVVAGIEAGGDPGDLARIAVDQLAVARFGGIDETFALQKIKEATGVKINALKKELLAARRKGPGETASLVSVEWPVPTARALVEHMYTSDNGQMTVRRWQNVFYVWDGRQYAEVIDEDIRAKIYRLFADHHVELPGRVSVDNTLDALRALSNVSSHTSMPSWLRASAPVPASEITAVRNGLLHIPTRELLEHDARFFNGGAVDVVYDTGAPAPTLWLKFLADAFPGDQESIDAMQQWFGYLLTSDTSQQKALICVGPKRCGKGTIGRVLKALLGDANYCGPTLNQLGRPFGMQTLIGKTLALVSDARVSGQADLQAIGEALLNITGEDAINVGRKGLPDWVGKLTTRFVLLTNILPGIVDSGGAVGSRFVVLKFTQSFFGREDPQLTNKLMKELPGILNWALDGLAGLLARGAFIQPATGLAAVDELKRKTTPLLGFIEDELIFSSDDEAYVAKDTVYARYKTWCGEEGMKFVAQKNNFFSELYSTSDGRLVQYRPHATDGGRISAVKGARLRAYPHPQETADRGANAEEFT